MCKECLICGFTYTTSYEKHKQTNNHQRVHLRIHGKQDDYSMERYRKPDLKRKFCHTCGEYFSTTTNNHNNSKQHEEWAHYEMIAKQCNLFNNPQIATM
jgi:hypothetical protein